MVRTPCGPFGASALDGFAENGEGSIGRDANAFSIALQKNSRPARMRSLPRCPRFYFCFLVQSFSAERAFKKLIFSDGWARIAKAQRLNPIREPVLIGNCSSPCLTFRRLSKSVNLYEAGNG